uniref:Putative secreted protein n=1 Tax=Anopheles marajoara TaxID=58244 RepID=A0A2M4CE59_9DIPT
MLLTSGLSGCLSVCVGFLCPLVCCLSHGSLPLSLAKIGSVSRVFIYNLRPKPPPIFPIRIASYARPRRKW